MNAKLVRRSRVERGGEERTKTAFDAGASNESERSVQRKHETKTDIEAVSDATLIDFMGFFAEKHGFAFQVNGDRFKEEVAQAPGLDIFVYHCCCQSLCS